MSHIQKKATARSLSVHLTDFFFLFSPLFSTCRYVEQRSSDAPRSSRPECHSYGSKCRWDDSLHAGSKLHHRHHLSRISVCSLCCHGMLCLCMKSVFSLLKITDWEVISYRQTGHDGKNFHEWWKGIKKSREMMPERCRKETKRKDLLINVRRLFAQETVAAQKFRMEQRVGSGQTAGLIFSTVVKLNVWNSVEIRDRHLQCRHFSIAVSNVKHVTVNNNNKQQPHLLLNLFFTDSL